MRDLTKDELEYIMVALVFQLDADDGTNPPYPHHGESALDKVTSELGRRAKDDRARTV